MKIAPISTNNIYANFLSKKKPMKKEDNNPDTFSKTNAGKHFIKGVISPVTNVIKHPVTSLCAFGVVAGVCSLVPVLSSILTIGFGVLGVAGLCKSTYNAAKFYKDKEYRKSEESFEGIGQGALTTLLTAFGLKQSAKTVKEAKLMAKLNVTSLDNAAKRAMAREVKYDGYFGAVKENFSLFTTKEGFNALKNQFSFRNIKSRAVDIFKFITKGNKNVIRDIKSERVDFKSTEQYKKRAGQTTEEIKAESQQIVDDIFKEFGYDKAQTPNVLIFSDDIEKTGYYVKELHLIELNEVSHKEGLVNIREVLGHESVHAREQILRSCLSDEEKTGILKNYLLNKINKGDSEFVIFRFDNKYREIITPPKMDSKMRTDFSKFAEEILYQTDEKYNYFQLKKLIKPIVEKNEGFIKLYKSKNKAVKSLAKYALAHKVRYKNLMADMLTKDAYIPLPEIDSKLKSKAVRAFINDMDTIEGMNICDMDNDFLYRYTMANEEKMAETFGKNLERKYNEKLLKKLVSGSDYDIEEEAQLLHNIAVTKYSVKSMDKEKEIIDMYESSRSKALNILERIKYRISERKFDKLVSIVDDLREYNENKKVITYKYTKIDKTGRHPLGQSVKVPYNTVGLINGTEEKKKKGI